MSVRKVSTPTKDGRQWVFETRYKNLFGEQKRYTSKKYKTKREAIEAEVLYLSSLSDDFDFSKLTFKELYYKFFEYQKDKVKATTLHSYQDRMKYLTILENVKLKEFDFRVFEQWQKEMNNYNICDASKNDVLKMLKILLNYASDWYSINFNDVYKKIKPFKDPNAPIKEEMLFYTPEEFKEFISYEDKLVFKCAFEILYFCGLRRGELLGLTWKCIDFEKKCLYVKNNLVRDYKNGGYTITSPKTKSSIRTVPLSDFLLEDLKLLKEYMKDVYGFQENWYVLAYDTPLPYSTLRDRKVYLCKKSGVKEIRIHDFRHSCASLLISNGANITLVARYLGHTKIDETLNTYSHFFKSDLDNIVSKLEI